MQEPVGHCVVQRRQRPKFHAKNCDAIVSGSCVRCGGSRCDLTLKNPEISACLDTRAPAVGGLGIRSKKIRSRQVPMRGANPRRFTQ
jgi:hypothetical protein